MNEDAGSIPPRAADAIHAERYGFPFRAEKDLLQDISECGFIQANIQNPGDDTGIDSKSHVRAGHGSKTLLRLSFNRRVGRLYVPDSWVIKYLVGLP